MNLAYIDGSGCIKPLSNGTEGQILLMTDGMVPAWGGPDGLTVVPPSGFSSTKLDELLSEMADTISTLREGRMIVADGNSITDNPAPLVSGGHWRSWPYWVISQTGERVINAAVDTTDISECRQRAPVLIDSLIGLTNEVWLVIWEGTNYLNRYPDVTACYDEHVAYCNARKAAGFAKVYVGTIISRQPGNYTTAQRNDFNARIRANWPTFADGLLDFASIPQIGGDTSYTNSTYFRDQTHLTDVGSKLVADYVISQLGL